MTTPQYWPQKLCKRGGPYWGVSLYLSPVYTVIYGTAVGWCIEYLLPTYTVIYGTAFGWCIEYSLPTYTVIYRTAIWWCNIWKKLSTICNLYWICFGGIRINCQHGCCSVQNLIFCRIYYSLVFSKLALLWRVRHYITCHILHVVWFK